MGEIADSLDRIAARVLENFREKYEARDRALQHSREIVRLSANAIRAVHRGELSIAEELVARARGLLEAIDAGLRPHPDVYWAGFVHDAQKEFAEASITLSVVGNRALPEPEDLGVGYAAYLNGAGEAVGELRRQVLDRIRQGEAERCEELLAAMEEVYSVLVTVDFPDAMTGGLRRTTDATRGILERTRGDLTFALNQRSLERKLDALQQRLG